MTTDAVVTRRRPEGVEERPMGWWGTVLFVMVLATTYGALCFTYVYVRVASFDWPPGDIAPPALGRPALSGSALVFSATFVIVAARGTASQQTGRHRAALLTATALAGVHGALLLSDWDAQPFTVGEHAYASLYFVLPAIHLFLVAVGVVFVLTVLALSWHPEAGLHRVGTRSLVVYWSVVTVGGVLLLAVVYLVPHLWRQALVPT